MPVYKDTKTNTFYCKFYYTDYTGQRKQKLKRGFKLQREAKEWERQFLERQQGTPSMSFQSLYNVYIDDISHRLRQSSVNGKINVFKNRILPYFKDKPVNEITPADIRAWQNNQLTAGYSEGYLCRINTTLSTIFNYAVQYYGLTSNPCTKAGHIGKHTRSLNFWTVDQYNQFMASLDNDRARMAIELLFYGGMRIGELLALTPADIDHENNMISINKTYHETEGGYISPPKTNNSTRRIFMPKAVMDDLKAYTERIYGIQSHDRIFDFSHFLVRNAMIKYCKLSGVPFIRIHDLRHSHVSLLIEMGFTAQLIAERIGDTPQMIMSIYGHLYPSRHQEVADKLNNIIVSN